jgi:hypothetical protein
MSAFLIVQELTVLDGTPSTAFQGLKIKQDGSRGDDPIDDYGQESYTSADSLPPSQSSASALEAQVPAAQLREANEDAENAERITKGSIEYMEKDTSVVDPAFKGTKRIIVDANFHYYRDQYGLTNPDFNHSQLEDVLKDVTRTWMKANIWVRFKKLPKQGELIRDEGADAMRWWVFGYKNIEANATRYWQDVDLFLTKGASKMTRERAQDEVIRRHREYNGHSLMNWVLNLGANKQSRTIRIDIYTVGFWPW